MTGCWQPGWKPLCYFVYYELDDNTSAHVLKVENYGGDTFGSWVLLEPDA